MRILCRPVADDGESLHDAGLGPVVARGIVLRRAVVPEGDAIRLPLEAYLVLRNFDFLIEPLEQ